MSGVSWESVIAVFGLAVPVVAALWEFVLAGRKRLGYRVQMDTTVRDSSTSGPETRVFQRMQWDGRTLADPSVVLLRIENVGWSPIVDGDYVAPPTDPVGVRIAFPGRRVVGMAVTERSDNVPRSFFEPDRAGFATTDGVISLPKVILNRRAHYKVLAVLDREESFREPDFPDPVVTAGVVGGVRGGTIKKTEYYPFASRPVRWLLALLVLVSVAQSVSTFARGEDAAAAPLDCAEGTLHLSGSTAFRPVLELAAAQYTKTCPGARIPLTDNSFRGSVPGLDTLAAAGRKAEPGTDAGLGDRLAFSDGPKSDGRPQLLPRPVALSLFTLVVSEDTGVRDLSLKQVRDIYAGRITNWSQVKGRDLPIQLVSRHPGSGTRSALEKRVLDGRPLPAVTTNDCRSLDTGRPGRCEVGGTPALLDTVATTPGALGHSEVGSAAAHEGVRQVRIDGYPATLEGADQGAYPFWETEIAYTYGEPPADSIAAGFLRYLADEVGKDVIRSQGHRPCSELDKPLVCRPAGS
ncbi:substrate-binding domain-containing protein [Streptomyces rochei]